MVQRPEIFAARHSGAVSSRRVAQGKRNHRGTEMHRGSQRKAVREREMEQRPDIFASREETKVSLPFSVNLCASLCLCGYVPSLGSLRCDQARLVAARRGFLSGAG